MSELIIGTECGGSDPTSGLAANPLIGQLSDLIVKEGGTSILSETTEFIGAEHLLARRAINKEVHDRIFEIVHRYEGLPCAWWAREVREGNPSPGNKAGGLTCLEEKSLGCIHKGGHSPVMAVYDYAKQVEAKQGLVIMDTPGNDPPLWRPWWRRRPDCGVLHRPRHPHRQSPGPRHQDHRQQADLRQYD